MCEAMREGEKQTKPKMHGAEEDDAEDALLDFRSLGRLARASVVSRAERVWRFVLGFAAFFELLAYALPFFFLHHDDDDDEASPPKHFLLFPKKVVEEPFDDPSPLSLRWFDEHRYRLGVIFSALWFVHAFVSANAARNWTLQKKDRKALLQDNAADDAATDSTRDQHFAEKEGKEGATATVDNDQKAKAVVGPEGVEMRGYDEMAYNVGGAWGVFAVKALWYVMLLPVGFYMLSLVDLGEIFLSKDGDRDLDDTVTADGATDEDLALEATDDVATFGNRVVTKQTRYCLAYASFIYAGQTISRITGAAVRTRAVALAKKLAKRMTKFAFYNPRRAKRRLAKALTVLRWVKYLLPLVGTGNKLLGNSKDLLKKARQSRRANAARRIREKLWTELDPEARRVEAAVVIQSNFRAHRVLKAQNALRLLQMRKYDAAVLRIQGILRKRAAAARVRVMRKKQELRELQMRQLELKKERGGRRSAGAGRGRGRHVMSAAERRRIYQLQDQLGVEFQKSGTGMLLRPNTKFAVTWKVLFVVCVALEIAHLAVKPRLAKYKDGETGKPLTPDRVLEHMFVPDPTETWAWCIDPAAKKTKKKKARFGKKGEQVKAAAVGGATSYYGPWYCGEPWRTSSRWAAEAIRFVIQKAIVLVGLICFMDVFVTFFTGELDEENGALKPKPFLARWLLPGLLLQLLVNPMMSDVAAAVHWLRRAVHHVGPARVWRWTRAFLVPAFTAFVTWFEWSVWRRFVKEKNHEIVKNALIE